jgi:hypothetical protein
VSLYDYQASKRVDGADLPFYGLIMAAVRKADTANSFRLRTAFPDVYAEFQARYNAPGGILPTDAEFAEVQAAIRDAGGGA